MKRKKYQQPATLVEQLCSVLPLAESNIIDGDSASADLNPDTMDEGDGDDAAAGIRHSWGDLWESIAE